MRPFIGQTATGLPTNDPTAFQSNLPEPVEEKYFGTPVSNLCREQLWKYEENPLDIWDKLLAHADENRAPAPDDLFRFKFHGLFYVAPAQDSFMLWMRVPGGILTAYQLHGLAAMATDWGCGRVGITTRANLQIREFQTKDIVRVLNKLQSLGLSARGSGADNIRNITASPITGLDPAELCDVAPLAEALHNYILNRRDMYGLRGSSTLLSTPTSATAMNRFSNSAAATASSNCRHSAKQRSSDRYVRERSLHP